MPQGPSAGRIQRLEKINQQKFEQENLERDQRKQLQIASRKLSKSGLTGGAGPGVTKAALMSGRSFSEALPEIQQQQNRADVALLGADAVMDNVNNQQKANAAAIKDQIQIPTGLQQPASPSAPSVSGGPFNPFSGKLEKMFKGVQTPETRKQLVDRLNSLVASGVPVNQALQEVQRDVAKFAEHEQRQQLTQAAGSLMPGPAGAAFNAAADITNRLSQANLPQPAAPITGQQTNMQQAAAAPIIDQFQQDKDESFLRNETFDQMQDRRRTEQFEDSQRGLIDSEAGLNRSRGKLVEAEAEVTGRREDREMFDAQTRRKQIDEAGRQFDAKIAEDKRQFDKTSDFAKARLDLDERLAKMEDKFRNKQLDQQSKQFAKQHALQTKQVVETLKMANKKLEAERKKIDADIELGKQALDLEGKKSEMMAKAQILQHGSNMVIAMAERTGEKLLDIDTKKVPALLKRAQVKSPNELEGEFKEEYDSLMLERATITRNHEATLDKILTMATEGIDELAPNRGGAGGSPSPEIPQPGPGGAGSKGPFDKILSEADAAASAAESRVGSTAVPGQPLINPLSGTPDYSENLFERKFGREWVPGYGYLQDFRAFYGGKAGEQATLDEYMTTRGMAPRRHLRDQGLGDQFSQSGLRGEVRDEAIDGTLKKVYRSKDGKTVRVLGTGPNGKPRFIDRPDLRKN